MRQFITFRLHRTLGTRKPWSPTTAVMICSHPYQRRRTPKNFLLLALMTAAGLGRNVKVTKTRSPRISKSEDLLCIWSSTVLGGLRFICDATKWWNALAVASKLQLRLAIGFECWYQLQVEYEECFDCLMYFSGVDVKSRGGRLIWLCQSFYQTLEGLSLQYVTARSGFRWSLVRAEETPVPTFWTGQFHSLDPTARISSA